MIIRHLNLSLRNALRGLYHVARKEPNFRIQLVISALVIALLGAVPLRTWEVVVIILLVVSVLTMELLNTAVEKFIDLLKPRLEVYVGVVKDIMAAAVLVTSFGAAVIGIIIFHSHFIGWIK